CSGSCSRSVLERVVHQDRVLALGAGRQQSDGAPDQFLDAAYILDRLRRQFGPGARPCSRGLPTLDRLVNRLDHGLTVLARRQMIDLATVKTVSNTNLKFLQPVQNVELRQGEAVDAAGAHGLSHKHGVEPAAAPRTAGHGAEFASALPQQAPDLVRLLGRERSVPHPRRVVLADTAY